MSDSSRPTGLGALAQRVILCDLKIKKAKQELEELQEAANALKEEMLAALASSGLTSVKYQGFTVYVHESIFASLVSCEDDEEPKGAAIKALKDNGLGWMVKETVASQTLSAWVREQETDDAEMPKLPEAVASHIKVSTKIDIRTKKSPR